MKDLRECKPSGTETQHLGDNEGFNIFIQVHLESRQPRSSTPLRILKTYHENSYHFTIDLDKLKQVMQLNSCPKLRTCFWSTCVRRGSHTNRPPYVNTGKKVLATNSSLLSFKKSFITLHFYSLNTCSSGCYPMPRPVLGAGFRRPMSHRLVLQGYLNLQEDALFLPD